MLFIPLGLVLASGLLSYCQTQATNNVTQNQQQEDVLVNYEKDISDLLTNQQLGKSNERDAIRVVAQAKTLAALNELDPKRKGFLIRFIYEAQLISTRHPIVDLSNADLSNADLSNANLDRANLSKTNLNHAKLSNTNLSRAYLDSADLSSASLDGADLSGAFLWNANLSNIDLTNTRLSTPEPNGTSLQADLTDANFCGTKPKATDLQKKGATFSTMPITNCLTNPPNISCLNQSSNPTTQKSNLENDSTQWHNFYNPDIKPSQATATESSVNEPNMPDTQNTCINKALQVALLVGPPPNTGVQAYRTLQENPGDSFELSLLFYIPDEAPIQALAFSMQQWVGGQEFQWALQWQQIGNVTTQQPPPNWRIWTGSTWQDIGSSASLTGNPYLLEGRWNSLDLQGTILNKRVQYKSFTYNGRTTNFTEKTTNFVQISGQPFPPVPMSSPPKLVAAIELDGNSQEEPYDLYIDNVSIITSCSNPTSTTACV